MIELTPGEFFDRYTILLRKRYFMPDEYAARFAEFQGHLANIMTTQSVDMAMLVPQMVKLMMVNTDIWNLESDMRRGKEAVLGEAEVGRRALLIRDKNKKRIECVNRINDLYGIKEMEVKIDHGSE